MPRMMPKPSVLLLLQASGILRLAGTPFSPQEGPLNPSPVGGEDVGPSTGKTEGR